MEEWRDIAGYEGLYQVSNMGRVRSLDHIASNGVKDIVYKGKILKQQKRKGYFSVMLSGMRKPKRCFVHRLVAGAFIPNPDDLPEINHKDENPGNNCTYNLEWCDRLYNAVYGTKLERQREKKSVAINQYDIDGNFIREWTSATEAEKAISGKFTGAISHCINGKTKSAYGYIWRFKEVT